ncbi:MAG: dTDP-4-dehydrorhamnose reductase [Firmicutes bacterium]|nr:dTDP-4-dehydrorhamnose reductase [Bacillota bacterium]
MKIFVTGCGGQLGSDVAIEAFKEGIECIASGRREEKPCFLPEAQKYISLDITDLEAVKKAVFATSPDVLIHCAAWTNVDGAEDSENRDAVYNANVTATENLAKCAEKIGAKMIYISTDYVFGDLSDEPISEDDGRIYPLNFYGETKFMGEQVVKDNCSRAFTVRISWVFGKKGNNFVKTMLSLCDKYESIKVVNDQWGRPTYTPDLAKLLLEMSKSDKYGTYHATNEGEYVNRYDMVRQIYAEAKKRTKVYPVSTEEYGKPKALRPKNSKLSTDKLKEAGFTPLPPWKDAIARYIYE